MSLKAFHIVFVTASLVLALGIGVWSLVQYRASQKPSDLAFGLGSLVAGCLLAGYGRHILRKLKHFSYF